MPMSTLLNIAIAEPSVIIRSGLEAVLKRLPGFRIQIIEIATAELLQETLRSHKPDMLIINPSLPWKVQQGMPTEEICQLLG